METPKKVRLTIKISEQLAAKLLEDYQAAQDQSQEPIFKEEYLGDNIEKIVNGFDTAEVLADSLVDEAFSKKEEEILDRLDQHTDLVEKLSKRTKSSSNRAFIAALVLLVFTLILLYQQKQQEY